MSEGPLAGGSPEELRSATRLGACGVVCPAASHFLLPGQEKVTKEKAAPLHRLRVPCAARSHGRLTNLPWQGTQDVPAALIRVWRTSNTVRLLPVRPALLGGAEGETRLSLEGRVERVKRTKDSASGAAAVVGPVRPELVEGNWPKAFRTTVGSAHHQIN
jgi:hypothetical protein